MTIAMTDARARLDLSSRSTDVREVFLARHAIIRTERAAWEHLQHGIKSARLPCEVRRAPVRCSTHQQGRTGNLTRIRRAGFGPCLAHNRQKRENGGCSRTRERSANREFQNPYRRIGASVSGKGMTDSHAAVRWVPIAVTLDRCFGRWGMTVIARLAIHRCCANRGGAMGQAARRKSCRAMPLQS